MGKMTSKSIELLEQSLSEWKDTCPGAGWEHHTTSALVSLAMTAGMQQLLELAAIGIAAHEAEVQRATPR
jgi:pantoate kinase